MLWWRRIKVGALHGIGSIGATQPYNSCCNNNGALMAAVLDANTKDIRPDDPLDLARTKGKQTVQTYWLDILEYGTYKANNQFYLAGQVSAASRCREIFDPPGPRRSPKLVVHTTPTPSAGRSGRTPTTPPRGPIRWWPA